MSLMTHPAQNVIPFENHGENSFLKIFTDTNNAINLRRKIYQKKARKSTDSWTFPLRFLLVPLLKRNLVSIPLVLSKKAVALVSILIFAFEKKTILLNGNGTKQYTALHF